MAWLGLLFLAKKHSLKKLMWIPCLRSFAENEAHHFFCGAKLGRFGVGGQKFMQKKIQCLFCPLDDFAVAAKRILKAPVRPHPANLRGEDMPPRFQG